MAGNPFTSAQAPQAVQMLAPDLAAQQMQVARQQQLADMLRQQALQPDPGTQVINGWAVKKSPLEALGRMATALMATKGQSSIDDRQLALAKAMQGRMADVLGGNSSGPDRASAALSQGATVQPSAQDNTGTMVNQGGVGPTVQNAERMDAIPQPAPNNFNMGNLLRGQVIKDLGGDAAGTAYWDQFKPTEGMKTDKYLGITPEQSRTFEIGKRLKEGYIAPTRLGEGAYADSNGNVQGLPTAAPPGYINVRGADGQWTTAPVSGGVGAIQESEKAKKLGQTLGTLGQGFDKNGEPAYFIGVPPGTAGAPPSGQNPPASAPAPVAPRQSAPGAKIDLTNMTPQEKEQVMAEARRIGYLRPGSKPGTSIEGSDTSMAPTPVAAAPTGGVIRPGNAPGFNDYQQGIAKAASDRFCSLIKQAQESPSRVNVLDNILDLSKSGVATGPTADWNNKIKGIAADTFGIKSWKGDASSYQELMKFMAQNASRAWQAAGGTGTDAQLNQQVQGNVNGKMFPQAVQGMARYAKAGELALQGMTNAMQTANITDHKSQQQFEATWRQNMDPRIYQLKVMDPAEAQGFVANLKKTSPAEYQSLMKKALTLKQMGGL
jgi:hypothetical protein